MAGRLIDVHTHFLPATLRDALLARRERPRIVAAEGAQQIEYGPGSGHPLLEEMVDLDLRLRRMAAAGIDAAVLSVNVPGVDWFGPEEGVAVARAVNDELVDIVRAHPGVLDAMACLPMQSPEEAAAELERAVGLGLVAGMVYSNVAGRALDAPEFAVVFATAERLGVPVYLHPTHPIAPDAVDAYALLPAMGFLFDTAAATMRLILGGLFDRHPRLSFVISHAGSVLPLLAGRIDVESLRLAGGLGALSVPPSEHIRRLYTDAVSGQPATLRLACDVLGADRIMFGTDVPFWQPEPSLDALARCGVEGSAAEAIRSGTAERLFGLQAPPA